jgi:hypothetical protein
VTELKHMIGVDDPIWSEPSCFPWVTFDFNAAKNVRIEYRLTLNVLIRMCQALDSRSLQANSLGILDGIPRQDRVLRLVELGKHEFEGEFTETLVRLTTLCFTKSETDRQLLEELVTEGPPPRKKTKREIRAEITEGMEKHSRRIAAKRAVDEQIQSALASGGGSYWYKGSGKGWDGQWHRSD